MPLTIPAGILTKANFIVTYLKPLVDANETAAANAQASATAANTLAGQKYTKPSGGIPNSDLATPAAVLAQVVTGGSTRVAGGAFHLFNDPAVTPVSPVTGDLWVGDIA